MSDVATRERWKEAKAMEAQDDDLPYQIVTSDSTNQNRGLIGTFFRKEHRDHVLAVMREREELIEALEAFNHEIPNGWDDEDTYCSHRRLAITEIKIGDLRRAAALLKRIGGA